MATTGGEAGKGFTVVDRRGADDEATAEAAPTAPPADAAGEPQHSAIDFSTFVISLGTSVLVHLGELEPHGGDSSLDLPLAQQTIDILGMLAEKTRGNLTKAEAQLLEQLLFDLRMKYVEAKRRRR